MRKKNKNNFFINGLLCILLVLAGIWVSYFRGIVSARLLFMGALFLIGAIYNTVCFFKFTSVPQSRIMYIAACACLLIITFAMFFIKGGIVSYKNFASDQIPNPVMDVSSAEELEKRLGFSIPVLDKRVEAYSVIEPDRKSKIGQIDYADGSKFRIQRGTGDISGIYGGMQKDMQHVDGVDIHYYEYEAVSYAIWEQKGFSFSYLYTGNATEAIQYMIDYTAHIDPSAQSSENHVKSNYQVKQADAETVIPENELPAEAAADLGAQNLWKLFHESLKDQTIYMTYEAKNDVKSYAVWHGEVAINNSLFYYFELNAFTGEYYYTSRWDYGKETEPAQIPDNFKEYEALAREDAKNLSLIWGNVTSAQYTQTRTMGHGSAAADILVQSDQGDEIQLGYSLFTKELISANYVSNIKKSMGTHPLF